MARTALGFDPAPDDWSNRCWCCGNEFPAVVLTPLSARPEASLCPRCAEKVRERARKGTRTRRRRRWPRRTRRV